MRSSTSSSTPLSKMETGGKAASPASSATGRAPRPFPVSNGNTTAQVGATNSDQVRAMLDTLSVKLIRSEAERDTLKKLVEETRQTQQRLERELSENRKELADTRKKMEEQRVEGEQSKNRQERLDEKLRETQANTLKLTRKIEADEQRRHRIQRRMDRLETIATEAQNALTSRAMVLLTDAALAERSGLPALSAAGPALPVPASGGSYIGTVDETGAAIESLENLPWWKQPVRLNTSVAAFVLLAALGFGWLASTSFQNSSQSAVAFMADGSLARIDLKNGTLQPLQLSLKKLDAAAVEKPKVSESGQPLPQDKPVATDMPDAATAAPVPVAPESAPQKDDSLTGGLGELQDKAYAGVAEAQHDLAALYTAGSGVAQDYKRASYWFHQAARAGVANAAYNLGVLNHQGLGVEKNIATALDWYRIAALKGHPEAQYNLGIAYIEGIGTKYNPQLAAGFFQKAALSGITEAAYNLGLILENGLLSEPKPEQALIWYRVGMEGNSMEAKNALEQLARRMKVEPEKAGLLPDGTSLSRLVVKPDTVEPATGAQGTPSATTLDKLMPELAEMIPNESQILIAQVQEQLTRRSLYDGPEDGALSQRTVDSVKRYQKTAGIESDGKPSTDMLLRMLREDTALDEK